MTLRVISLIGLAAYKIDSPLDRLWAVIGANIAVLLSQVADWTAGDGAYQGFRAFLLLPWQGGQPMLMFNSMSSLGCRTDIIVPVQARQSFKQSRYED